MDIGTVLSRSRWFAGLSASVRAALIRHGRVVRLAAGQWVYGEGDEDTGLCAVLDGSVRLEASAGPDRDVLIDLAHAVTVFGQSRRHGGGPRIITARAGSVATVMLVSDRALERIAEDQHELWRAVSALVYGQLDASVHMIAQLLALPPRERVSMRLRTLASDGVVRANQADLAELTGLSRKAVNAHLAALERAGKIRRGYGSIALLP